MLREQREKDEAEGRAVEGWGWGGEEGPELLSLPFTLKKTGRG